LPDTLNKIAVFIDFDNIEIGVRTTMGLSLDVGVVLEALKERGEVVSKTAYSDWKRAGDYSRVLSQHAIKMVQRNLTPGGDKNGADINLALDALEMAFTHGHINTFVIVGGDSDFISLVEKLKQYDKKVFVVGGRQFTSQIMQRNCHQFIAYENLVGGSRRSGSPAKGRKSADAQPSQAPVDQVVPLVRRALGLLAEREVSPQLGLLKSTLLQLDSTFSEKSYGASTFLDFAEKLAAQGVLTIRRSGHNLLVDLTGDEHDQPAGEDRNGDGGSVDPKHFIEGVHEVKRLLLQTAGKARWPMYIRNVKQLLRSVDATFDERKYGFSGFNELLRACAKDGLLRLERGRQGVLRVLPGAPLQSVQAAAAVETVPEAEVPQPTAVPDVAEVAPPVDVSSEVAEPEAAAVEDTPKKRSRTRATAGGRKSASAATKKTATRRPRTKKAAAPPVGPNGHQS
jgi:uncharacterized LabA/DUF88 family protein